MACRFVVVLRRHQGNGLYRLDEVYCSREFEHPGKHVYDELPDLDAEQTLAELAERRQPYPNE